MITSLATSRGRLVLRKTGFLVYPVAAALGLLTGYSSTMDPRLLKLVLVLPALVFTLTIPPETIFAGWLFLAPLLQGAAGGADRGHILFKFLYFIPPLILAGQMVAKRNLRSVRSARLGRLTC
jgi:hypothetical protein